MLKKLDIYTETEKTFILKACDLLKMTCKAVEVTEPIKHTELTINGNTRQFSLLTSLMAYNYENTF